MYNVSNRLYSSGYGAKYQTSIKNVPICIFCICPIVSRCRGGCGKNAFVGKETFCFLCKEEEDEGDEVMEDVGEGEEDKEEADDV